MLVTTTSIATAVAPSSIASAEDVVQPTQLFAIARGRLVAAAQTLTPMTVNALPGLVAVDSALRDAERGARALHSAIVPDTAPALRVVAANVLSILDGVTLAISAYRASIVGKRDPILFGTVPDSARRALEASRLGLLAAAAGLPG